MEMRFHDQVIKSNLYLYVRGFWFNINLLCEYFHGTFNEYTDIPTKVLLQHFGDVSS